MCVSGAIIECDEALCHVRMYVCMCLKLGVNYGQTVDVFVICHDPEWVYNFLRILNLEGLQNCMIG